MCHNPDGFYYDAMAGYREAFPILVTGMMGVAFQGLMYAELAAVAGAARTAINITNQSASKANIVFDSGKAGDFYKILNPSWDGTMPEIGYEGFKAANGTRVWMYPAEMSNQGMSTIKITARDGYQLILRFPEGF